MSGLRGSCPPATIGSSMIRLDAHQHFWKYSPEDYGWITGSMESIRRDFLFPDLEPLLNAQGFHGSIAVQARQSLAETRWLLAMAADHPRIKGVVGWVDLCSLDVRAELEELASNPQLVGVRHVLQDEPDDAFMLRPEFRRGIAQLEPFGLVYDILIYPRHLPLALKLVREFPRQQFVLDHLAKPAIAEGLLEPWASDLRALAGCPNVACKLSGMVTEARWHGWSAQDFAPYLEVALEAFGPDRLMIGSDWPVCLLSGSYEASIGIVRDFAARLSQAEQDSVFGGGCARAYGIRERG